DLAYEFADGAVTQVWTERAKTPAEIEAEKVAAAEATLYEQQRALVPATLALIAALQSTIPDVITAANGSYWDGQEQGQPWRPVTSYVDAYPLGWEVTHNGKTWVALREGASGEPGVVTGDWQEKQEPGEIVDWVQPQAGSEYPVGAIVRHNGHLWRNDHTGPNGWEPGTTGSQWTDLGPTD